MAGGSQEMAGYLVYSGKEEWVRIEDSAETMKIRA